MSVLTQILMQSAADIHRLRDIKPPVEVTQSLLLYFMGGVVVFGVVVLSAFLYVRKRPAACAEVSNQGRGCSAPA